MPLASRSGHVADTARHQAPGANEPCRRPPVVRVVGRKTGLYCRVTVPDGRQPACGPPSARPGSDSGCNFRRTRLIINTLARQRTSRGTPAAGHGGGRARVRGGSPKMVSLWLVLAVCSSELTNFPYMRYFRGFVIGNLLATIQGFCCHVYNELPGAIHINLGVPK